MTNEAKRRLIATKAKKAETILDTAAASREKMIKSILDKIFRAEDEAITRELAFMGAVEVHSLVWERLQ